MTVQLETVNQDYQKRICKGMSNRLQDKLVEYKLIKKTNGWKKLPDGAVVVEEQIFVPRDELLWQEII
jgi:hypothetical protein